MRLLASDEFASAQPALAALLAANEAQPLQVAAIRALSGFTHVDVGKTLLAAWENFTPAVREEAVAALLARRERVGALLTALESSVVALSQLSAARRAQLLANADSAIQARASKLLGQGTTASRADVVARYKRELPPSGDLTRGAKIYDTACAACHRYAGRGVELGPNLETVRGWDREKLLLNILDPNREVAANFVAYVIELKDGTSLSGMITDENAGSVTLKRIGAPEETILRQNIAKVTSSSVSLMPEGLESTLTPQDMADVMAFLLGP